MTTLNFSDQPVRRGQSQPGPLTVADGADVSALEARVTALEAAVAALEASVTTLEATVVDHEARITALEP